MRVDVTKAVPWQAPLGREAQGRVKGLDVESSPLPAPCFSCHPQDSTSQAGEGALGSEAADQVLASSLQVLSSRRGDDARGEADGGGFGRMRLGRLASEDKGKGGNGGRGVKVKTDGDLQALLAARQRQLEQAEHAGAGLYFVQ